MPTREFEFLSRIYEHEGLDPESRSDRLVFADWLDDRGDVRAQFIRVEEQRRQHHPASDRFWELKTLRDQYLPSCDPVFLRSLRHNQAYTPVFSGEGLDWKGRWRLLREFADRWCRVSMPDCGRRPPRADECEARIGQTLSSSLVEWIAFLEDVAQTSTTLAYSRRRFELFESDWLVIDTERIGDTRWLVHRKDLHLPDPPVHVDYGFTEGVSGMESASTLSEFAIRNTIRHAAHDHKLSVLVRWADWGRQYLPGVMESTWQCGKTTILESPGVVVTVEHSPEPCSLHAIWQIGADGIWQVSEEEVVPVNRREIPF